MLAPMPGNRKGKWTEEKQSWGADQPIYPIIYPIKLCKSINSLYPWFDLESLILETKSIPTMTVHRILLSSSHCHWLTGGKESGLGTIAGREADNSTWFICQFLIKNEYHVAGIAQRRIGVRPVFCQNARRGFCCLCGQPSPGPCPHTRWDLESHLIFSICTFCWTRDEFECPWALHAPGIVCPHPLLSRKYVLCTCHVLTLC